MYNFINEQNQETGFAYNEKERGLSNVFSALMRKVYVWMTFALVITGVTAYGVASSPTLLTTIYTNSAIMWGLIIAEFVLVFAISGAINRLSLGTATLLFILYSVLNGATLSSIFVLYEMTSIAKGILHYCWYFRSNGFLRIHDQERFDLYRQDTLHGFDWSDYRYCGQYVPEESWL